MMLLTVIRTKVIHAGGDNCYSANRIPSSQHAGEGKYSKAQPKAKPVSLGINQQGRLDV